MPERRRYRRKRTASVVAMRLTLDTKGLVYRKWGGEQRAKRGDWLVDNDGDVYSVDGKVFARTYRAVSRGLYVKKTPIWAEVADCAGVVATKEGKTRYRKGDYIVSNDKAGSDRYAVKKKKFEEMYTPDR